MFSADCVALLAKVGYSEEDFGSFDHVSARINAAKDRVAKLPPPPAPPAVDPHARDRQLAVATPSHLTQDGVMRKAGKRGDVCSSHVDGYDGNMAPCMPMSPANEALMGAHEQSSIANRGLAKGQVYPAAQVHQDSSERVRHIPGMGENQKGTVITPPPTAGTSAPVAGIVPQPTPGTPPPASLDGTTAAECIESFRQAGFSAILQNCKDNKAYNQYVASPQYKTDLQNQQAAQQTVLTKAQGDVTTTTAAQNTANADLRRAQKAGADNATLRPLYEAEERARRDRDAAIATRNTAQADLNTTNATLAQLPGVQRNAQCRYDQAVALEGGSPRVNGVAP